LQAIVAAGQLGQSGEQLYSTHKMKEAGSSFTPGDPAAAFEAVLAIMNRETKTYATTGSICAISTGAKTAFTAADFGALGGTLLGAAEQLALLVQKIYLFARDWNEMRDANELLQAGTVRLVAVQGVSARRMLPPGQFRHVYSHQHGCGGLWQDRVEVRSGGDGQKGTARV
jgi:hypothetical protein